MYIATVVHLNRQHRDVKILIGRCIFLMHFLMYFPFSSCIFSCTRIFLMPFLMYFPHVFSSCIFGIEQKSLNDAHVHTVWGGRLCKRFCNLFSESSTGLNCSCHFAQASKGNFQKICCKTLYTTNRPRLYCPYK